MSSRGASSPSPFLPFLGAPCPARGRPPPPSPGPPSRRRGCGPRGGGEVARGGGAGAPRGGAAPRPAGGGVGGGALGDEPLKRLRERRPAERAVHLVGPGAPVAARHVPEPPVGERRGELARAHAAESITLAGEGEDGVRPRLEVAVHRAREVDAEERELGIGAG